MTDADLERLVTTYNAAAACTERLAGHVERLDRADPAALEFTRLHRSLDKRVRRLGAAIALLPGVEREAEA